MKKYNKFVNEGKEKRVIYTAVFLTKEAESILKAHFPPKYENLFYHHSTIKFMPSQEEVDSLPIGKKYIVKVIGIAKDDKAEAVLVENKFSTNETPHITLSTNTGVKPQYSNELLKGNIEMLDKPILLEGVVGAFK